MKKGLKWTLIVVLGLVVVAAIAFPILKANTKKNSPETTLIYKADDDSKLDIAIRYSQPSKKGRVVFGGLVPYGRVWRTGANEATEFTTQTPLTIGGKTLAAGKYTLWTIPEKDNWTVIWNSKQYMWGIKGRDDQGEKASREPESDVLQVQVPVKMLSNSNEKFSISLQKDTSAQHIMSLTWDNVEVNVPIKK